MNYSLCSAKLWSDRQTHSHRAADTAKEVY